ncbi:MAG TPA: AsmA family protein, partial [Verrucomicrobiae bacterium]|nr:AsmA family protein [Verrucomicrobiae bacterium]
MPEASSAAPKAGPRKRHSWLRALGWLFGIAIVLLVALYFLFTSSSFLKKHVLPRVSKSLNAKVTASSVSLHPFSQVVLRDVKVQTTNQAPLLTATEVRIKYHLLDVLGGNIRIDEAVLTSPIFQLVQNPDGSSNLDPLTRAAKTRQKANAASKSSKAIQVDIRKLILSDATLRKIQNHKVGTRDLVELTNVDLTLTGVKNDGSGKLQFSSVMHDENNPPAPAMYGLLRAKIDGSFDFTLGSNLQPTSVLGDAHLKISQAAGSFSDFANLEGTLHGDVSATEFKSVTLNFEKEGFRIGELRATGPYNASKAEGSLNVELLSVDKQVLNLFGARFGIDFGSTTMTSTNTLEVSNAGASVTAAGQLRASKFQLGRTNESTPPIDLRADYNLSVDKAARTALLRNLNVAGAQNGRPLLRGELTSPMTLAWGNTTNAVGDSSLNLTLTKLNIAEWKAFAGNLASAGTLDMNMKLLSQEGGTRLTFDTTNRLDGLTADIGAQHITDATVLFKARGRATDLRLFDLREYNLQLIQSNQPALVLSGSGTYDRTDSTADLQVTLEASLPRALHLLSYPDISASAGTAELEGRVMRAQQTQTVTGNLNVTKFTGKLGASEFRNFGATMDLDVEKTPTQVDFHKVTGSLSGGRNSGGDFEFSGFYNLSNKPSQLAMTFSNFNQDGLRPLLEPLFANKRLVSVSMNGNSSVQINPKGSSVIRADMQVSNLVVDE